MWCLKVYSHIYISLIFMDVLSIVSFPMSSPRLKNTRGFSIFCGKKVMTYIFRLVLYYYYHT